MDKKGKQVGPQSSSFAVDLFGPKDSSTSSNGYYGSMFGPSTTKVRGRDTNGRPDYEYAKHDTTIADTRKKEKNYENERSVEPCYYNSSIYYGGQEVYTPTSQNISTQPNFQKDGGNDANESNSSGVSRGNWWKGSFYY